MATLLTVDDPADPRVAEYVRLTDTRLRARAEPAAGLFIAEGEKVIRRAHAAGYPLRSFLLSARWVPSLRDLLDGAAADIPAYVAAPGVLRAVTGYDVHRGALASYARLPLPQVGEVVATADRVAVLEDFVDPTNVGLVFRSAAALGVDAVVLSPRCADPLYRRAVKTSMGAVLSLPYARFTDREGDLGVLRSHGLRLLALTPDSEAGPLDALTQEDTARCALLLGAEGSGLSARWLRDADLRVRIPMRRGVDSLNVAAAAAVAFYALGGR